MLKIVNIGCGMNVIPGAINLDNSPSIKLRKHILLRTLFRPFLNKNQRNYLDFAISNNISYGEALDLPLSNDYADVIYTSHMIEHLDSPSMERFLQECHRCLKPSGVLRIVTPNLDIFINNYIQSKDAISFAYNTMFYRSSCLSFKERCKMALSGDRGHKIIYNSTTLTKLLESNGFSNCTSLSIGQTTIDFDTNIDFSWRSEDSLYIEARKI